MDDGVTAHAVLMIFLGIFSPYSSYVATQSSTITQELLACLLTKLEAMLSTLASQGFDPLQEAYMQAWLHTNQQVCPVLLNMKASLVSSACCATVLSAAAIQRLP